MTSKYLDDLSRRIGPFPIELPAAALMAAAAALVTVALPDWRFESAVTASGLPAIVSAAQPPLGQTARTIAALALAGLSFLAVWFGLRALDRKAPVTDFPAFRAADLHPDAPRRRPILAGAEFGAPADDLPPIEEQIARRKPVLSEPMPSFLAPQPPAIGDFMAEPQDAVFEEVEAAAAPAATRAAPAASVPPADAAAPHPRTAAVDWPLRSQDEPSVGDLMQRLENGLVRRGSTPVPGPAGEARDELRRALGDLNRMSRRG